MSGRFQIEDLVEQDASGVLFRAMDVESGRLVALRRFFPFGAGGGGLDPDERAAYEVALGRLAEVCHPALRRVVAGGCDPVDDMPFLATEWVEGDALDEAMAGAPLPPEVAVVLLTQALEVCEVLSQVLSQEAVWVETALRTIIVCPGASGRRFTFGIAPLKWLGTDGERGIGAIISLTEDLMGWQARIVSDQAGNGLGGWLRWLRETTPPPDLQMAREMLAASVGAAPPVPTQQLVADSVQPARPARPRPPVKRPSSAMAPVWVLLALCLIATAIGGWMWNRRQATAAAGNSASAEPTVETKTVPASQRAAPAMAPPVGAAPETAPPTAVATAAIPDEVARANQRALELALEVAGKEERAIATLEEQRAAVAARGGIFAPEDCELLLQENLDKEVVVEGVLEKIEFSSTRATMYLVFAGDTGWNLARGAVVMAKAGEGVGEEPLGQLTGRRIRIRGKVDFQKFRTSERPLIHFAAREAIEELP